MWLFKMRSYWNRVGLESNMNGVLIRKGKNAMQKWRHKLEWGAYKPRSSRVYPQHQKLRERYGPDSCSRAFREVMALLTPWLQTCSLQNWEQIHFCFKPPSLWYFEEAALENKYVVIKMLLLLRTGCASGPGLRAVFFSGVLSLLSWQEQTENQGSRVLAQCHSASSSNPCQCDSSGHSLSHGKRPIWAGRRQWQRSRCPQRAEWRNMPWYSQGMEYHTAIQRSIPQSVLHYTTKVLQHVAVWTEPKCIVLS